MRFICFNLLFFVTFAFANKTNLVISLPGYSKDIPLEFKQVGNEKNVTYPLKGKFKNYSLEISILPGASNTEILTYQIEDKAGEAICNGSVYTTSIEEGLPYTMFNCSDYRNSKDLYFETDISNKVFWKDTENTYPDTEYFLKSPTRKSKNLEIRLPGSLDQVLVFEETNDPNVRFALKKNYNLSGNYKGYTLNLMVLDGIKRTEMLTYQITNPQGEPICNGTIYTKGFVKDMPYTMFNCSNYKNGGNKYIEIDIANTDFWKQVKD